MIEISIPRLPTKANQAKTKESTSIQSFPKRKLGLICPYECHYPTTALPFLD